MDNFDKNANTIIVNCKNILAFSNSVLVRENGQNACLQVKHVDLSLMVSALAHTKKIDQILIIGNSIYTSKIKRDILKRAKEEYDNTTLKIYLTK